MILPVALVVVFSLLSLLHVSWAFGGTFGWAVAVPEADGRPLFTPSRAATLLVAAALAACAVLVAALAGWLLARVPAAKWLGCALSLVFLLRAMGDFKYIGFFKRVRGTRFARFDTWLFSPLCLTLALGVFAATGVTGFPPMQILKYVGIPLAALLALGMLDRLGLWAEARGWIYWRKRKPSGNALGATALELQRIFESGKARHVVEAKHDASRETPDPGAGSP